MESVPALMDDVIDAYLNQANEILDYDFGIDPLAPTPNEIIPNFLWLGSKIDANNTNKLGNLSITHILVCASLCSESKSEDIVSYKIYASDTTDVERLQTAKSSFTVWLDATDQRQSLWHIC
eukprot:93486_1